MVESKMALEIETAPPAQTEEEKTQPRTLGEIILEQLKMLQGHHLAVLENGSVEAVHKMRVTTRRLQASLDLLLLKDDELGVRKLKKQLRRWRQLLSTVRNYDVFLIVIDKQSSSRRGSQTGNFDLLKSVLEKRRERRMQKIYPKLMGIDVDDIAVRLGLDIDGHSVNVESSDNGAGPLSARADSGGIAGIPDVDNNLIAIHTAARLEQRLSEFLSLAARSEPATDPTELHELRIAAKRVRYILEIVSELGYGNATRALQWLKSLQDKIGDWHDLESLEDEIISIASRRKFTKKHLTDSSNILKEAAHLRRKKDALVARLFPVKVPRTLTAASGRLTKALRKDGVHSDANDQPSDS